MKKTKNDLIAAFESYNKILGKKLTFFYYKDTKLCQLQVEIRDKQFKHLTGLRYIENNKDVSSKYFYKLLKNKKISDRSLKPHKDGFHQQKLNVLKYIDYITEGKVRILDGRYDFKRLSFEKGIRTSKDIFLLALAPMSKNSTEHAVYVPKSLLNIKDKKSEETRHGHEVYCIVEDQNNVLYIKDGFKYIPSENGPTIIKEK